MALTHDQFKAAVARLGDGDFNGTTPKIGPLNRQLRNAKLATISAAERDAFMSDQDPVQDPPREDEDPHVPEPDDQDPIDQDPVDPEPEPEEPPMDNGRNASSDTVKVVVMATTNIILPSQAKGGKHVGKVPFRGVVDIPRAEFDEIVALDRANGREPRLLEIGA